MIYRWLQYAQLASFYMRKFPVHNMAKLRNDLLTYISLLNILAVKVYGEAEFWLSGGKVTSPPFCSHPY